MNQVVNKFIYAVKISFIIAVSCTSGASLKQTPDEPLR